MNALIVSLLSAALALSACSNSTEQQAKNQALEKTARQALDKASAVQQDLADAEARRRQSAEQAEQGGSAP